MAQPGPWAISYPLPPPPGQTAQFPYLTPAPAVRAFRPRATAGEMVLFMFGLVLVALGVVLILLLGPFSLIGLVVGGVLAGYVANHHWGDFPFTARGVTGWLLVMYGWVLMIASVYFLVGVIPMLVCLFVGYYLITPKKPKTSAAPVIGAGVPAPTPLPTYPTMFPAPAPWAAGAGAPPPPVTYLAAPGPSMMVPAPGGVQPPAPPPQPSPVPVAPPPPPTNYAPPAVPPPPPVVSVLSPPPGGNWVRQVPPCPGCGGPTTYLATYGRFFCSGCGRWI